MSNITIPADIISRTSFEAGLLAYRACRDYVYTERLDWRKGWKWGEQNEPQPEDTVKPETPVTGVSDPCLRALVAAVRDCDAEYLTASAAKHSVPHDQLPSLGDQLGEALAWRRKQDARLALSDAIIAITGVNIDTLRSLTER